MATRLIYLSIDPDNTDSYSVSLSKQSGTFNYSGIYEALPGLKQIVDIQGMAGTVERITPSAAGSQAGHSIEGRMLPMFQREFMSINFPEKDDGAAYYVKDLIDFVALKAGTTVDFTATNNAVKTYKFTGRFVEAAMALADQACGELIQQNGTWLVIPKGTSIGTFTVPIEDLISCKQSEQSDIMDMLMGIVSSIRSLYDELYQLAKRKGELEAELARLQNTESEANNALLSNIPMGPISFEFGCGTSKKPTPIPNNLVIEGGVWEEFTPNDGESLNPENPGKKYYQVRPKIGSGGQPTSVMQGCTDITQAVLLYPANEPSNASGRYFAKGLVYNLVMTGGGFGGSNNIVWEVAPEYRVLTQYDELGNPSFIRQLYFGFIINPGLTWGEDNTIEGDKHLYRVNIEMSYKPVVINKWRFSGTIEDGLWAITKDNKFNGYVGANGIPYSLTGTTLPLITDIAQLDGTLVEENVVKNSSGQIVGSIDATNNVRNLLREDVGVYNPTMRSISLYNKLNGFVAGGYVYKSWPGLSPAPELSKSFNFYSMEYMILPVGSTPDDVEDSTEARLQNEINKLALDQLVANQKITCLTAELGRYGAASITAYIKTATDAWHAFYDTQEGQTSELPPAIKTAIALLETTAVQKDDELMLALSLVRATLTDVDITFLYDNVLPMPGNQLLINGTMLGFNQTADCGILDSISFNGFQVTVRARKYGTR